MGERCPEQRHEAITQELIDGTFVPMDLPEGEFEEPVQQRVHCLRSNAFSNGRRVRQVTEEYGDLFPFAFEGTPGGQNLLGKVFRRVGQGFACLIQGWSRGEYWRFRDRGRR
jgi:hypothetical protein